MMMLISPLGAPSAGGGMWMAQYGPWQAQGSSKEQALNQIRQQSYQDIYSHEAAHKAAAGRFGGPINIQYDGNGIAVAGHVNVAMPVIDPNNLDGTIAHAKTVMTAATAPEGLSGFAGQLSDADMNVASQAQSILNKAQAMKAQQGNRPGGMLNLLA